MSPASIGDVTDDTWTPIDVHIRRVADGLVRVYSPIDWGWWNDGSDYQWGVDGNFGCDCNRYLFFQRAADEEEADERPCSERRYRVRILERATGRVLFSDDEVIP
jgi:hypothetical protein